MAFRLLAAVALLITTILPAAAETIQLEQMGGVYMLPVRINDTLTVPFVLDSGAAEVVITEDVFSVLKRAGTIKPADFIGVGQYTTAGGAAISSERYVLHKVGVGTRVVTDVVANVVSVKGDPLLGQTFLQKLPAWTLDNAQHALVLSDDGNKPEQMAAVPPPPRSTAKAPPPAPPALLQDLFTMDMLNIQVPFLESRIGVARRVSNYGGEQQRSYKISGCDVTAYVRNNAIVAYALVLGGSEPWRSAKENCNITIPGSAGSRIVGGRTVEQAALRTNGLTIGKFIDAMGMGIGIGEPASLFHSACVLDCGNAADPTVEFHWDGPHSLGFMNIDLMSIIAYGPSITATDLWKDIMVRAEGGAYVRDVRFNCDPKYQKIGLQAFRNVEVYQITIRMGDRPPDRTCRHHR